MRFLLSFYHTLHINMHNFADIFIWSSTARIILRVYFIVALMLVCLLGDRCLHSRAKIRLLRGEDIGVASECSRSSFADHY